MKIWIVTLVAIIGGLSGFAATTVKKARPQVSEGHMLLSLPNRFYYFDGQELHCYNTKTGEDTLIVKEFECETGGSIYRIDDSWYDAASDCVYINMDLGGSRYQYKSIYQLTPDHKFNKMIDLGSEDMRHKVVKVTDDYVYLNGTLEDISAGVKIPGVEKDSELTDYYSLGFKPWKFTKKSLESLKKPNIDFYAITAPGVNVRAYGDSKAPRFGSFEYVQFDGEFGSIMPEDADIDLNEYTRTFKPWHPEAGSVFASSKGTYNKEGWTNIIVEDGGSYYEPVVSSKFVKQVKTEPLVSMQQIPEDDLEFRMWKMNSEKYPGVWFMISKDYPEEPNFLRIGKEIDGMIVFKWGAPWLVSSGEEGRFHLAKKDGINYVYYGKDITQNRYELDFSKLNDNDLETLFKAVFNVNFIPVVVKIADGGVRTFVIKEDSYVPDPTESAPQYAAEPAPVSTPEEEEIFIKVDQQAEYPGGMPALMKWLGSNISYPKSAQQNGIQGRVIVKFVVEKDGSITQPKVVKGVDEDLDNEALRVINKMPKWIPGKINGVPVRTYYTLPVGFRLTSK